MKVWILLLFLNPGSNSATTMVIDNIASVQECERVRAMASEAYATYVSPARDLGRCVEVYKVMR